MDMIQVSVSPSEVLDKITILEIKSERMDDPGKLANVQRELKLLEARWRQTVVEDATINRLHAEIKAINEALWDIEDEVRECERNSDFGPHFIDLARSVYKTNDQRSKAKKELNVYLGSDIIEEKSYRDY